MTFTVLTRRLFLLTSWSPQDLRRALITWILLASSFMAGSQEVKPRSAASDGPLGAQASRAVTPISVLSPPKDFDLQARDQAVLNHLNAVVRVFRIAISPIQKVGEPSDVLYRDQAVSQALQIADLAFESSRAEAALLSAFLKQNGVPAALPAEGEGQKLHHAPTSLSGSPTLRHNYK